jgi:hypothetical protein
MFHHQKKKIVLEIAAKFSNVNGLLEIFNAVYLKCTLYVIISIFLSSRETVLEKNTKYGNDYLIIIDKFRKEFSTTFIFLLQ